MVFEKVTEMLAEICDTPAADMTADSTFESLEIDSLDVTELVMKLEDEFSVTIDMDTPAKTVGELVEKIEAQQK